jgi:CheY-like chemotaxis protein
MPSNRALVVDDSRSARHILSRMLESFGLKVDALESAELALTYLQTTRPDVIFMDHLMPGMDGFAAVRVIKANPDTATIPVLMYTSQEGEMYLSQARALGAMGVLPKTLKHADVAEALQQLNLHTGVIAAPPAPTRPRVPVVEREATPVAPIAPVIAHLPAAALAAEQATAPLSVPQLAHRIATEVHAEMLRVGTPHESMHRWRRGALFAGCVALLLLCAVIYQQTQLRQQLLQLQTAQQLLNTKLSAAPAAAGPGPANLATTLPAAVMPASVAAARIEIEVVSYGEVPLSGARLEKLRELVEGMRSEQIKGTVRVETFMGDFCLSGNPAIGYALADDDLLVSRCDLVGNPFGDALTVQQRQSVAFANLVASINSNRRSGILVQVVDSAHKPVVAYPALSPTLTAAAWNAIAERNQRVEFTVPTAP